MGLIIEIFLISVLFLLDDAQFYNGILITEQIMVLKGLHSSYNALSFEDFHSGLLLKDY